MTKIDVNKGERHNFMSKEQLEYLAVNELIYHNNSLNQYIEDLYFNDASPDTVTHADITYLKLVQSTIVDRLIHSSI